MPRRRDIEPSEIKGLLPYLQITELIDNGARVRYRLVGTAIVRAFGSELTGKYFDEILSGERLQYAYDTYRTMCSEKRPVLACNVYFSKRETKLLCNRILMPLSEDGAVINQCLVAMTFHFPSTFERSTDKWFVNTGTLDIAKSSFEVVR